jgi:hypothetical protein
MLWAGRRLTALAVGSRWPLRASAHHTLGGGTGRRLAALAVGSRSLLRASARRVSTSPPRRQGPEWPKPRPTKPAPEEPLPPFFHILLKGAVGVVATVAGVRVLMLAGRAGFAPVLAPAIAALGPAGPIVIGGAGIAGVALGVARVRAVYGLGGSRALDAVIAAALLSPVALVLGRDWGDAAEQALAADALARLASMPPWKSDTKAPIFRGMVALSGERAAAALAAAGTGRRIPDEALPDEAVPPRGWGSARRAWELRVTRFVPDAALREGLVLRRSTVLVVASRALPWLEWKILAARGRDGQWFFPPERAAPSPPDDPGTGDATSKLFA